MQDAENLVYMGVEEGASVIASRLFHLTVPLVSHRGWSMTHRCHGPPECYVGTLPLAATQGLRKAEAASTTRRRWQRLLKLKQRRLKYGPAKQLWNDISVARNSAIRAMYCLFERDQFRPNSTDGCHLLRRLLEVLPDSKTVEDSHNVIRADVKRCKSDKRNVTRIQDVNLRSKVLGCPQCKLTSWGRRLGQRFRSNGCGGARLLGSGYKLGLLCLATTQALCLALTRPCFRG